MTDDLPAVSEVMPPAVPEYEELPIPAGAVDAWPMVEQKCRSPRLKHAMLLCLNGYSQRESLRGAGLSDRTSQTLRDGLKTWGLLTLANSTDKLVANHREIAIMTTDKQLENLHDGRPVDTSLSIVSGIHTDKVKDYERWTQREDAGAGLTDALGSVAEKIIAAGGRLEARLTTDKGEATLSIGKDEPEAIEGGVVEE